MASGLKVFTEYTSYHAIHIRIELIAFIRPIYGIGIKPGSKFPVNNTLIGSEVTLSSGHVIRLREKPNDLHKIIEGE